MHMHMTQAQCDVVINTMRPHSFGTGDCMIEQGASSNDDLHFYIVGKGTFDIHRKATPHGYSTVACLLAPSWLLRLLGEHALAAALGGSGYASQQLTSLLTN